ncbi:MAG: VWA domain-containing protein [Planctomycetota bacterium]|nr:VWA domain-containing protein [Planctomycetota bacterium]
MTSLYFQSAEVFWVLAAAVPLVFLFTWRSRAYKTPAGAWVGTGLRVVWVVVCVAAGARPTFRQSRVEVSRAHVVVVEDRSRSVRDDLSRSSQLVRTIMQSVPSAADKTHLCFSGGVGKPSESSGNLDQTDIEAGLNAANAISLDSQNARIILLTDGRATRGDAEEAARRLALRGGRVDVVPIGRPKPVRPRIVQVEPPPQSRVGVPAGLRVVVQSEQPVQAQVRLLNSQQQQVDQCDLVIEGRQTLLLHFTPESPGTETYWIDVVAREAPSAPAGSGPGAMVVADSQETTVFVEGPPRLLLCDNFPDELQELKRALRGLNVSIDLVTPADWPKTLAPYAAVVISDWSGKELTSDQREQLQKHVEETGAGLLFIGGDNVMASQWRSNPLAELLPVILQEKPAQVVKKQPQASVCFVLDRSGSMSAYLGATAIGAVCKLDMVKTSVIASIECLSEESHVAVVVFDEGTDVVVDPVPANPKKDIADKVDTIQAGGGTAMAPAIRKGLDLLAKMPGEKYLIVLTDGLTNPPLGAACWDDMTGEARQNGVSWTSIAVGADADTRLMSSLATKAAGKYYFCRTADQIPQVFIKEAKAIRRVAETKQKPFRPQAGPLVTRLKGLAVDDMPVLKGLVLAKAKDSVDEILWAQGNKPLLTEWQFGLGKVACFTSDAKNAWGQEWISWQKYSTFWVQVVQGILRPPQPFHVRVRGHCAGNKTTFTLQIQDGQGRPVSDLECQAKVFSSSGSAMQPAGPPAPQWRTVGPAEYEASVLLPDDGKRYLMMMTLRHRDGRVVNYCARVSAANGSETIASGPDLVALRMIADAGQGVCSSRIEDVLAGAVTGNRRSIAQHVPVWPALIMIAILLWPVDLLIRKLA